MIMNNMLFLLLFIGIVFYASIGGALGLSFSSSSSRQSRPSSPLDIPGSDGINTKERTVVILFHKRANVVTSHISEDSRSTVYDEVQSMKGFVGIKKKTAVSFPDATGIRQKLHAIGRLDADTTGLLLLTNDGGLVHHVTNKNAATHSSTTMAITKTYEALIMGHHDNESLKCLWEGVDIGVKGGGMTQPVHDLKILEYPNHKSTSVSLTISEGKNRQVRRMFHAIGSGVMKLKRTHVGKYLSLQGLDEGQWRILSDDEVKSSLHWEPRTLPEKTYSKKKQRQHQTKANRDNPTSRQARRQSNSTKRRRRRGA